MNKRNTIPEEILEEISQIRNDTVHGATFLTIKSIQVILSYIEKNTQNYEDFKKNVNQIIIELANAQPTMASILNYCNSLLFILEENEENEFLYDSIKKFSQKYLNKIKNASKEIISQSQNIIQENDVIFTYSNSSTVSNLLIDQKEKGKEFIVYCSESRPKNEGIILAEKLADQNIETILVTDASLFSNIRHADHIIIGADAIIKSGIINKIGSCVLSHIATCEEIPIHVLCCHEKVLPYSFEMSKERLKDPSEIYSNNKNSIQVMNTYFDRISFHDEQSIITQNGTNTSSEIISYMKTLKIHNKLKKI